MARLEGELDAEFGASQCLIVYGSLAPGREHHDQLAELRGEWREGWVTGTLHQSGWGAALGYSALEWSSLGPRVPALLFTSPDLPDRWSRLDAFEGAGYRRIVVPFFDEAGGRTVANVYVLRQA